MCIPDKLGESSCRSSRLCADLGFHHTCIHIRGAPELAWLLTQAHPSAGMLRNFQSNVNPVNMDTAMAPWHLSNKLRYRCRSSATRDAAFVRARLEAQTDMVHIGVLPWEDVRKRFEAWFSRQVIILKEVCCSQIIYDYMWINLNSLVLCQPPEEAMQFGQIIPHLLCTIFHSNPRRGPVFVSKINLSDAHMRV